MNSATHRYSCTHELIEAGLVRKVVCTAAQRSQQGTFRFRAIVDGRQDRARVRAARHLYRAHSRWRRRHSGFYTPVGFGTELAEGKEVRRFEDRDFVLEHAMKGDSGAGGCGHRRPLRQSVLSLCPDELRPRHGGCCEPSPLRRCAGCSTSRCRTNACNCQASMSTAWSQ